MKKILRYLKRNWLLYVMILPGIVYFVIFKYAPMYGITISFRDYNGLGDIMDAPWIGLKNYADLFSRRAFTRALRNTLIISLEKIVLTFPIPIILALFIDSIRKKSIRKMVQTSVILPNFISWVVIYGLMYAILGPSSGVIRQLLSVFGYEGTIPDILSSVEHFRKVIIGSHIWKGAGIGTIVYLAAFTAIDPQLYEAAAIDGAGPWQQLWHIKLTGIRTTILMMFIFRVGDIMYAGFDQIYAISNDVVISVADIIDTYVYRIGLEQRSFSLATAAGFFQSLIGLILVLITNAIARKIDPDSAII